MPDAFMQRVRAANAAVATMRSDAPAPVKELLAVLVPPPGDVDIAVDDSSEGTAEWMGQDGTEEREGLEEYEGHAQYDVLRARERLAAVQRQYQDALGNAFINRPRPAKRAWGEEAPKPSDEEMGEEKIATLNLEQTVDLYRDRLRGEQQLLEILEQATTKDKIPVRLEVQAAQGQQQRSPRVQVHPGVHPAKRNGGSTNSSSGAAVPQNASSSSAAAPQGQRQQQQGQNPPRGAQQQMQQQLLQQCL